VPGSCPRRPGRSRALRAEKEEKEGKKWGIGILDWILSDYSLFIGLSAFTDFIRV
jgi:hypothetical protein